MSCLRCFLAIPAFLVVSSFAPGVSAAPGPSEAQSQSYMDDRFRVCVPLSVGPAAFTIDGSEYSFKQSGVAPVIDTGIALCGLHVDFGFQFRLMPQSNFVLGAPALGLRLHTRSPVGAGVEGGLALRLGVNILHASDTGWDFDPTFDGSGAFAAGGPGLRVWLNETWGLSAAADIAWGAAGDQLVAMIAVTAGAVARW